MESAGYSGKSLVEKLGMKAGMSVALVNPPDSYFDLLDELPEVDFVPSLTPSIDFIHFFTTESAEIERQFPLLKHALSLTGQLWISWPKGSSKVETDLNENIIRELGLAAGLVDVKVAAIDETWSALKFVYRVKDR